MSVRTMIRDGIQVVVAIDFGTTYSGYAYVHIVHNASKITIKDSWGIYSGRLKTPTAIKYKDESCTTVESWGFPALIVKPRKKQQKISSSKPIELFKLHLLDKSLKDEDKPVIPDGVDYKNVIKDYLIQLRISIEESLERWPSELLNDKVKFVLTVPAEFDDDAITIMRDCAFNAGLIKDKFSNRLRFMAETEAAAIHCLDSIMKEDHQLKPEETFMVVDCGGGTVDLSTHELLKDGKRLSEITERTGDNCGSSFVDKAFLDFLGKRVGDSVMKRMKEDYYCQLQYVVQMTFCQHIKTQFTGKETEFQPYDLDLEDEIPAMKNLIEQEEGGGKISLQESDWVIKINFEQVKAMFDPVIERIIQLIRGQLDQNKKKCSAIFLVGGFSESKYLQNRIKKEFSELTVAFPIHPATSVLRGGILYGLDEKIVAKRVLKRTYGTEIIRKWQPTDPPSLDGLTMAFEVLARRGNQVSVDEKVIKIFRPGSLLQRKIGFDMYVTHEEDAKFCDDTGVSLLREWDIELPENEDFDQDIKILFTLTFDTVEILAVAVNQKTGEQYKVTFRCM